MGIFISKIKKVVVMAMSVIIALPSKIFATIAPENYINEYQTIYGVRNPDFFLIKGIWNNCKNYNNTNSCINRLNCIFKKSKNSTKKKVLVTILTIAIVCSYILYS